MPGGLLNISATGSANLILTGTPTKTFFKAVYSKYTNFGLQKFRIDYDGMRELKTTTSSVFQFRIPRYAELLMDTYICITLPDIWSPIYHPCENTSNKWAPYDFRWINDLGASMIEEITITCGALILQKYTGQYLSSIVERDFSAEKRALFNRMSGNTADLNDPANSFGRANTYPSAYFLGEGTALEPSIRGKRIYVPIHTWFTADSRCAFPLAALRYNELYINVTIRPIQQLFQVRDVFDYENKFPYVQPDFTQPQFATYRFLQPPPGVIIDVSQYTNQSNNWNADVHLLATYCFLSEEEKRKFCQEDQVYLVKDVYQYKFDNVVGTKKVQLTSSGMVANWILFFQRNDVYLRNEWTNYTNWPYREMPSNVSPAPTTSLVQAFPTGPATHPPGTGQTVGNNTGYYISGPFSQDNVRNILISMGISLSGAYRENVLPAEIFELVELYGRSDGCGKPGLYFYNFCLRTSPFEYQPSGAMNLSKFKEVELEVATILPVVSANNANIQTICDLEGNVIGVTKQNWRLYDYGFNMTVFEERYNVLSFIGGYCGMLYGR